MEWARRNAGWLVAAAAIIYAANATSNASPEAYQPPTAPLVEAVEYDVDPAYLEPAVAPPIPVSPEPAKGWYDPRYVSCIANCDKVEPRIPTEAEALLAPRFVHRQGPSLSLHDSSPAEAGESLQDVELAEHPLPPASSSAAAYVSAAESPAFASPEAASTVLPFAPTCAENGSCYGDISAATGRAKTVAVQGYYRSDGTYVRGHYRSRPR